MNIYRITRDDGYKPGTYGAAIVVADSQESAKLIHPGGLFTWETTSGWVRKSTLEYSQAATRTWIPPANVKVELIGENATPQNSAVILACFNAAVN